MTKIMILQGREVSDADIELIRSLMVVHPTWGRTPLSVELCRRWNWCNAQGRLKGYGGSHTVAEAGAGGSHPTTAASETVTECF